jgi:hypothetical protein
MQEFLELREFAAEMIKIAPSRHKEEGALGSAYLTFDIVDVQK